MSFELKTKKPIPSEKETKIKILATAKLIGCYGEAKRVLDSNELRVGRCGNDKAALQQAATATVIELYNLDPRLVGWLVNENGEIVVGDKVVLKVDNLSEQTERMMFRPIS